MSASQPVPRVAPPPPDLLITPALLPDVLLIEAPHLEDERGWFAELWNADRYAAAGLDFPFVQDNVSQSWRGVLRGMHFQNPAPQGKLITVLSGTVFDAVVDVRLGSPTFGAWYGCELAADSGVQLWVPEGYAHGFLAMTDHAIVHYACTATYDASADRSLAWDDPDVGIVWPGLPEMVSAKDRSAPRLAELARQPDALPCFRSEVLP